MILADGCIILKIPCLTRFRQGYKQRLLKTGNNYEKRDGNPLNS
jgi:hypothetical protein